MASGAERGLHHRCSNAGDGSSSYDEAECSGRISISSSSGHGAPKPLAPSSGAAALAARRHRPHQHQQHPQTIDLLGVTVQLPRTGVLVRVCVALVALLLLLQMLSCGLFFCVAPVPYSSASSRSASYIDVRDLVSDVPLTIQLQQQHQLPSHGASRISTPKLIPRIIHQTYRTKRFPRAVRPLVRSWRAVNGDGWEVRFYDDVAAGNFVRREFPEYLEAYLALPKDVERADFFKWVSVALGGWVGLGLGLGVVVGGWSGLLRCLDACVSSGCLFDRDSGAAAAAKKHRPAHHTHVHTHPRPRNAPPGTW